MPSCKRRRLNSYRLFPKDQSTLVSVDSKRWLIYQRLQRPIQQYLGRSLRMKGILSYSALKSLFRFYSDRQVETYLQILQIDSGEIMATSFFTASSKLQKESLFFFEDRLQQRRQTSNDTPRSEIAAKNFIIIMLNVIDLNLNKPILALRICLQEGRDQVLTVYPHSDVSKLARNFVAKHRLIPKTSQIIVQRINRQLNKVLRKSDKSKPVTDRSKLKGKAKTKSKSQLKVRAKQQKQNIQNQQKGGDQLFRELSGESQKLDQNNFRLSNLPKVVLRQLRGVIENSKEEELQNLTLERFRELISCRPVLLQYRSQ